jgi:hypothetical protein
MAFHADIIAYWEREDAEYQETCRHNIPKRAQRADGQLKGRQQCNGDLYVELIIALFMFGFGGRWSEMQIKIFHVLLNSVLPRLYGKDWERNKARVMRERGMTRVYQEVLVNMGRRNGKTWVVSAFCAAVFLVVPEISIAVFSVGKRQSGMFLQAAKDRVEAALTLGTHVKREGYRQIQSNQEVLLYEHPSGSKQVLGSYPGSIKVTWPLFFVAVSAVNYLSKRIAQFKWSTSIVPFWNCQFFPIVRLPTGT